MKVTFVFLVFCGVLGISFAFTNCEMQSDCEEDECCLDNLFFKRPYCEKRYRAGQKCSTSAAYKPETDLYYLTCPCVNMYKCLETTENGETDIKDPKCIMPTK